MANHTDDCPACGKDRRGLSFACCPAETARLVQERRNFAAEQDRRRATFERHGIEHRQSPRSDGDFEVIPHMPSLLDFLEALP